MKRFAIITEADARVLEPGTSVELSRGGHITPLALDTLRERRVTVVRADGADAVSLSALVPTTEIRTVAIASDHAGVAMRRALVERLRGRGLRVLDLGTEGTEPVDYPDTAAGVARAVAHGEADAGIAIDGAGIGSAIAANKIAGVRAALGLTPTLARYAREHNGANVLTLGSTLQTPEDAWAAVDVFLSTPMTEARYIRRLAKVRQLETHG
jgi:ribose 5-phosphate isomerase B